MPDVTATIDAPSIVYIIYANCDHHAAPLSVFSERGLFSDASYLYHVKVAYLRHFTDAYLRHVRKPIE